MSGLEREMEKAWLGQPGPRSDEAWEMFRAGYLRTTEDLIRYLHHTAACTIHDAENTSTTTSSCSCSCGLRAKFDSGGDGG